MRAIFERETKAHFNGIVGYAFIAFLLLFAEYTLWRLTFFSSFQISSMC
jgi:hypothetical protein